MVNSVLLVDANFDADGTVADADADADAVAVADADADAGAGAGDDGVAAAASLWKMPTIAEFVSLSEALSAALCTVESTVLEQEGVGVESAVVVVVVVVVGDRR